jgi:hypothetical protein
MLFLVLCLFAGDAVAAAAPQPPAAASSAAVVFAEGWSWQKLYAPIENGLTTRTRMIQMASLSMVIALYIIWMRK